MPYDRDIYFSSVKKSLFGGKLTQQQVDGQNALLDVWERDYEKDNPDIRWPAYSLATTLHESASTMWPVVEYGKGEGHDYGKKDPETGQAYYGRGFIQCTWRENYARADKELGLTGDDSCEWHADNQLKPEIAAATLYQGLIDGWFRSSGGTPNNLAKYFNDTRDDPYEARETTNGDKKTVPSWSNGVSIGNLIKGYHGKFLAALEASAIEGEEESGIEVPAPAPAPEPAPAAISLKVTIKVEVIGAPAEAVSVVLLPP